MDAADTASDSSFGISYRYLDRRSGFHSRSRRWHLESSGDIDLGESDETNIESEEDTALNEILDLDVLGELDATETEKKKIQPIFFGEQVLLLGGDEKHKTDYVKIVEEIGGNGEWYISLADRAEGEIAEIVNRSHVIMTLSAEAISDPGILQATNIAKESNKTIFQYHSANPKSIQKQLIKLVDDGKI